MADIFKGEDKAINITLKDNGVAIDLNTAYNGIACWLYYYNGNVLQKYSKNVLSGFGTLTVTDSTAGIFQVKLQSADTSAAKFGVIYAEVKTQTADNNYDSSTYHTIVRDIEIGEIKESNARTTGTI
jgi:hypothetical protein